MANSETIRIIKSTVPVLSKFGEEITGAFYRRLFLHHPELKDVFNMTHQQSGSQPRALADAIFQYAQHIDNLDALKKRVTTIAHKHASLSIQPEMYNIVGENLLKSISEVLGSAATPEILEAWETAFGELASVFIQTEENLYESGEARSGGFRGKKRFKVVRKEEESQVITSFYLQTEEEGKVPDFLPGQYISLTVDTTDLGHKSTRNYSLSDEPGKDYLRISVKREEGDPDGVVSHFLHGKIGVGDVLEVGMPMGDFVTTEEDTPVVLLAGGVGITPLLSMCKYLLKNTNRKVYLIQCVQNGAVRAFANEIRELSGDQLEYRVIYEMPSEEEKRVEEYDFEGRFNNTVFQKMDFPTSAEYYFCGPKLFMKSVLRILTDNGITKDKIFFEFFGPEEELL